MKANDKQVGGAHYKSKFQHWDYAAAACGPGYFKGNATKYLARWRRKNGLEDLEKARHYLTKLIELCEDGTYNYIEVTMEGVNSSFDFCIANEVPVEDTNIINTITIAADKYMLMSALIRLNALIESQKSSQ